MVSPTAVLVFQDNVEAGDDVAHQVLRAEADGQAGQPGKRGDGRDVDAKFLRRRQQRQRPDDFAAAAVNHAGQRARLLFPGLRRARLRGSRFDDQLGDQPQQPVDEQRRNKDAEQMETGLRPKAREFPIEDWT